MAKNDLNISKLKELQFELYEENKEKWNDMEPEYAKNHMLFIVEELGECISIIKKKGIDKVMTDKGVRDRFTEEFADVLMYYTEVLNRLDISATELSEAYIKKHETNMKRNYIEENKKKYNN